MSDKRLHYIDVAKGFAMILVITGHCVSAPEWLRMWLYTFHMPLFFLLTGLTFSVDRYKGFKDFFIRKVKTIVVPYFSLGIIMWIVYLPVQHFIRGGIDKQYIEKFIGVFLAYRLHNYNYGMWFLTCLFVSEIIVYFIVKGLQRKTGISNYIITFLIILFSVSGKITVDNIKGFYWSIDLAPFAMAFILLGYLFKQYNGKINPILNKPYITLAFFSVTVLFTVLCNVTYHRAYDMYSCKIGNYILYMLGALSGIVFSLSLALLIDKNRFLEYIGQNTLVYYACQNILVIPMFDYVLPIIYRYVGIDKLPYISYISYVITLIGSIIILAVISELINRFLPFAAGKKKQIGKGNKI